MVMSNITVKGVDPDIVVEGDYQRFIYSDADPSTKLQVYSQFVPVIFTDSVINIESRNNTLSGFRWEHTSTYIDAYSFGSFKFQSFISDGSGTDILGFDGERVNVYKDSIFTGKILGSRESGSIYWNNNATSTSLGTANTFVKASGTTTLAADSISATMGTNNRLSYTPTTTITPRFRVKGNVSLNYGGSGAPEFSISLYKNGTTQLLPIATVGRPTSISALHLSVETLTTLAPNDYIELWVASDTASISITVVNGFISFEAA